MSSIEFSAGEHTESLLRALLEHFDQETLGEIEIIRGPEPGGKLMARPTNEHSVTVDAAILAPMVSFVIGAIAGGALNEAGRKLTELIWDRVVAWVKQTGQVVSLARGDRTMTISPQTVNMTETAGEYAAIVNSQAE